MFHLKKFQRFNNFNINHTSTFVDFELFLVRLAICARPCTLYAVGQHTRAVVLSATTGRGTSGRKEATQNGTEDASHWWISMISTVSIHFLFNSFHSDYSLNK